MNDYGFAKIWISLLKFKFLKVLLGDKKETYLCSKIISTLSIGHLSYHLLFLVSLSCGSTISENNTYWESGGSEVGSCGVTICPCSTNICKVRWKNKLDWKWLSNSQAIYYCVNFWKNLAPLKICQCFESKKKILFPSGSVWLNWFRNIDKTSLSSPSINFLTVFCQSLTANCLFFISFTNISSLKLKQ